jgi:hypothetical protein
MDQQLIVTDRYDKEFINLILEIEKKYIPLPKHEKLKIESWIKKLCIPTINKEWKKNRNLHAILMLNMIINKKLEEPYDKSASEMQSLPQLNKATIKARLSQSFRQEVNVKDYDCNLSEFINRHIKSRSTATNLKNSKMSLKKSKNNF